MQAIGLNVVIKPDSKEKKTESGLIIPQTTQDPPTTGEVVSVGLQAKEELEQGDRVIYKRGTGYEIESKDKTQYIVVPIHHVLSKF